MSLSAKLAERASQGKPLVVGLIGAGKFGAMYLAQVPKTPGVHVAAIADLAPAGAIANLRRVGWPAERHEARSIDAALRSGATHVSDDWEALAAPPATNRKKATSELIAGHSRTYPPFCDLRGATIPSSGPRLSHYHLPRLRLVQ